jgi:uncharacterized protein
MENVSADIQKYIETEIIPKYAGIGGHTDEHIQQVITRSLRFAKQAGDVNIDMVYIIAAYHDLGRLIDDETHNYESAKMMRADDFLKARFSSEEIETMAEAVEDHRASLGHEPRSIYGKIVSSADRNTDVNAMLSRAYDYNKHLHPDFTEDETIEAVRIVLRKKYSPNGYAASTMYFDDPNFAGVLKRMEEITRDFETFAKIMREHNAKRGK